MLNSRVENTSAVLQTSFLNHQYRIGTVIYVRKAFIQTVGANETEKGAAATYAATSNHKVQQHTCHVCR